MRVTELVNSVREELAQELHQNRLDTLERVMEEDARLAGLDTNRDYNRRLVYLLTTKLTVDRWKSTLTYMAVCTRFVPASTDRSA